MLSKLSFSREPAVYIGLIGALLVAVIQSGVSPEVSANAAGLTSLVTLLTGIAIRFFVSPVAPAAPAVKPAA